MTLPRSAQLAQRLDPLIRDYINGRIEEDLAPIKLAIEQLSRHIGRTDQRVSVISDDMRARLKRMEDVFQHTPSSVKKVEKLIELLKAEFPET